ncbi:hypothetical protein SOVF_174530, partial [Spinacia oleracea]
ALSWGKVFIALPFQLSPYSNDVVGIKWGFTKLQGARDEMEDEAVIVHPDTLCGFSFAAVFDGHGGSSSVKFLNFIRMEAESVDLEWQNLSWFIL